MKKNIIFMALSLIAIVSISACSILNGAAATAQDAAGAQTTPGAAQGFDPANMPVETKLAIGTLQLEGTDLAVTAEEAAQLLPLWKAVKSLSASDMAAQEEIQALYDQIKETMSAEQMAAIEKLDLSQEDISALMTELGIEMPQFGGAGGMANLSDDERATRVAELRQNNGGGEFPQGGPGGGGGGGGPAGGAFGGPGAMPQGGFNGQGGPNAQGTPGANRRMGGGMNSLFIDPLIKMLEEKAG